MTPSSCPKCGAAALVGADGATRPGCDCAVRAVEAIRARRQAEIDAAEDFHPLRVRPYVTLQGLQADEGERLPGGGAGEETVPLRAAEAPASATAPVPASPAPVPGSRVPAPGSPAYGMPDRPSDEGNEADEVNPARAGGARRRPVAGLFAGAAALAVAAMAAFAGGLFSADAPEDRALPDAGTTAPGVSAAPAVSSASPSPSASPSVRPSASASASPSASPTPSPTPTPSTPSASASPAVPSAQAAESSAAPSTTRATGTVSTPTAPNPGGGTLRRGDSGPEVRELQLRLKQVGLFHGRPDGEYDGDVENAVRFYQWDRDVAGDPEGVYGPQTRRTLEAETAEP